ncbi:diacylglycerol/lipid kinase family protein [Furfurilactobacillus curtus]|uniref:Diacylglycerol kinase n=1 Tax=Furfurilactobacillus curtus TaxID=1746200 RepID=A0ABQ5JR07_9LACO
MNRHFFIILNRHAGRGHATQIWQAIQSRLAELHIHYQMVESKYPGHATLIAEQYAKHQQSMDHQSRIVLVVGGDGTLNQVLNGLQTHKDTIQLPLAYIPAGSGNDFARGAKLSLDPLTALNQVLQATEPYQLDIGHYVETIKQEHRYFVNNVGIGFDAAVVSAANHSSNKSLLNRIGLGSFVYLFQLLKVVRQQDAFPVTIHINQQRDIFRNAFLLTTSNHPYFGGGVAILPQARVTDGQLSLIVVEKMSFLKFVGLFMMMTIGRHLGFKTVHTYQAHQLHLTVSSLENGQVDGEEMGNRFYDIYLSIDSYPFWFVPAD